MPASTSDLLLSACLHLEQLGFRPDDAAEARTLVDRFGQDETVLARVDQLAETLRGSIGDVEGEWGNPFADLAPADTDAGLPVGGTAILTFLATLEDVRAAHAARGIDDELSWHSLSDLGQQVWVHRQTYGTFGLHTEGWVQHTSWRANLFWLGRLQFNLQTAEPGVGADGQWWLSTHIPQSGSLSPEVVDDSFRRALEFFPRFFPEIAVSAFHCHSWLLDPQLVEAVPGSNIAAFQQRWALYGEPKEADASVIFFVFRRRGDVDRAELPRRTTLERAVLSTLDAGGHWYEASGLITAPTPPA